MPERKCQAGEILCPTQTSASALNDQPVTDSNAGLWVWGVQVGCEGSIRCLWGGPAHAVPVEEKGLISPR